MSSERQLNDKNNPWWGEHLHRYHEVLKLIPKTSCVILDIACGTGFGSDFLAQAGNTVVGADLSESAIAECKGNFQHPDLLFQVMDGTKIPYPDNYFDCVVSFETIEHTTKFQEMLNEFKRVTKKEGSVIISTPNFTVNSPKGYVDNPFHTQEWIYEDLLKILSDTFSNVTLLGQEYIRYKEKNNLKYKTGKFIENVLYKRGIRKIPVSFQDKIMNKIINEPMYPRHLNYAFTANENKIKKCKTFFAICKP